jgi:hypothetical protein
MEIQKSYKERYSKNLRGQKPYNIRLSSCCTLPLVSGEHTKLGQEYLFNYKLPVKTKSNLISQNNKCLIFIGLLLW